MICGPFPVDVAGRVPVGIGATVAVDGAVGSPGPGVAAGGDGSVGAARSPEPGGTTTSALRLGSVPRACRKPTSKRIVTTRNVAR